MDEIIRIDNIEYPDTERLRAHALKRISEESVPHFQNEVWVFIAQWLSEDDTITVNSSGSTGKPKPIALRKDWMRRSAEATASALGLTKGMSALLCISPRHIGGMMMIVRALHLGLHLHTLLPSKLPRINILVDFTAMVPMQVQSLLDEQIDLNTYGRLIIGGAPISPGLKLRLLGQKIPIYATYGMTETASHVALCRIDSNDRDSRFTALEGVEFSSSDDERLCIRIAHFDNLIVQCNDLVQLIDRENFYWLGRSDTVINSGGLKIIPEQVEEALSSVLGLPLMVHHEEDDVLGQCAVLCIEGEPPSKERIELAMKELGDKRKRPKRVYTLPSFRRTRNGKLMRVASFAQEKKRLM